MNVVMDSLMLTVRQQWKESDARLIANGELLPFRDFSTSIHKVRCSTHAL
jgi:hypothetical protein